MAELNIIIKEINNIPFIYTTGEIDIYTCPKLNETLSQLTEKQQILLVLNLEDTNYIDSTGLGIIAYIARKIDEYKGQIYIIAPQIQIKKIFKISGLDQKNITLFDKEEDVLKQIYNITEKENEVIKFTQS